MLAAVKWREGFGEKYLGEDYDVRSAGAEARGLNPNAVKAMKEVGTDILQQTSKLIDPDGLNRAYFMTTLCGDAEERCPVTQSSSPTRCAGIGKLKTVFTTCSM